MLDTGSELKIREVRVLKFPTMPPQYSDALCKLAFWAAQRCHEDSSEPVDAAVRVSVEYSLDGELQKVLTRAFGRVNR